MKPHPKSGKHLGRFTSVLYLILTIALSSTAQKTYVGPNSGSAFATGTGNTWSNPNRAASSDNSYATFSSNSSGTSANLTAKGFGFNLPASAVIFGIKVDIERVANDNSIFGYVIDNALYLVNGATQTDISSNKADLVNKWSTTEDYFSYGSATDLWGATLTPAVVNSANFGIRLQVATATLLGLTTKTASVDHIRITLYYDVDSDGDGILNYLDLDCDNDGIPDYLEFTSCAGSTSLNWDSYANNTVVTGITLTNGPVNITTTVSSNAASHNEYVNNDFSGTVEKEVDMDQDVSAANQRTQVTFSFSTPVQGISFKIQDIDMEAGQFIDSVVIKLSYKGVVFTLSAANVTTSVANTYLGNNIFKGIAPAASNTTNGQVIINMPYLIDKIMIEYWNVDPALGFQGIGVGGFTFCHLSTADSDGDGIPNYIDLDSDNDGIPDVIESYGVDANGDGRIDNFTDLNGDGLSDNVATISATAGLGLPDFDGDGVPNYIDLDCDGDGVPDILEAGGADSNNDGMVDSFTDADGDGFHDPYDGDANNDGIIENTSGPLVKSGADTNGDGKADSWPNKNTDRMGYPNFLDLDSDGDGITDFEESGIRAALGLSFGSNAYKTIAPGTLGSDGWSDSVDALASLTITSTDADGLPDYLDIDSDNDGITDNVEAMATGSYVVSSDTDTDGDGLVDAYDSAPSVYGGNGLTPFDKEGDGIPDYRDTDSDGDLAPDRNEGDRANATLAQATIDASGDTDGDGLMNYFDSFNVTTASAGTLYKNYSMSNMGPAGNFNGPTPSGSTVQLQQSDPLSDRDWRNTSIVPLNIVQFAVTYNKPTAQLDWQSISEYNTQQYEVEYSKDGQVFDMIATTAAFNRGTHNYRIFYTLPSNMNGVVYFRVKQVDKDGKYFYTKIIAVKLTADVKLTVYPNPFTDHIQINHGVDRAGSVTYRILSAQGQTVAEKTMHANMGNNSLLWNGLGRLPAGTYYLHVINVASNQIINIVKQ